MKQRTRILIDARDLISDPSLWNQGGMETDMESTGLRPPRLKPVDSLDDPPRRCLSGAICAATGIPETQIESDTVTADVIALVKACIQNRYDGERKLRAFMTIEDIAHCEPSDNDWLVGFNDYSRHDEVLRVLDEAIAQSEPCQECEAELTRETFHLLTIDREIADRVRCHTGRDFLDNPEMILCDQCSLFYG